MEKIMFYILVPVYNVEKYIDNSIQSVINQTFTNWNLLLVDDGSTDGCGNICDKYSKFDNRIIVLHKKNQGLISARRTAINYVIDNNQYNNSYVVFLDSDDSLKENALETIKNYIELSGSEMIIYGMDKIYNNEIIQRFNYNNERMIKNKKELYKLVFNNSEYNSLCRKACSVRLFKKDNYEQYYNLSNGEDLLQSISLYKLCNSAYIINKSLYNYTVNPSSITHTVNYDNYRIDNTIRKKVFDFLENENVFNEMDFCQYRSYCISLIIKSLIMISRFDTNIKNKVKLFNDIKNDEYFIKYISKQKYNKKTLGVKRIIFNLFLKNRYILLINLIKLYSCVKTENE